jgi:hypothetical protein
MGTLGSTACHTVAIVRLSAPVTRRRSTHDPRSCRRGPARLPLRGRTVEGVNHRLLGNYETHALNQPNKHIFRPTLAADQPHLPTASPWSYTLKQLHSAIDRLLRHLRGTSSTCHNEPTGGDDHQMAPHEAGPRSEQVAAADIVEQCTSTRAQRPRDRVPLLGQEEDYMAVRRRRRPIQRGLQYGNVTCTSPDAGNSGLCISQEKESWTRGNRVRGVRR